MLSRLVLIVAWLSPIKLIGGVDWCSPELECLVKEETVPNTMCIYSDRPNTNRSDCINVTSVQTERRRQNIVNAINAARLEFSKGLVPGWPPAANMRRVSYDMELEQMALRWAMQCPSTKDPCSRRKADERVEQLFQENEKIWDPNVTSWDSSIDVRSWFEKYKTTDVNATLTTGYKSDRDSASFSQLIWAETTHVGCADVIYQSLADVRSKSPFGRLFICNFDPGGNVEGDIPYLFGPTCSRCEIPEDCLCNRSDLPMESTEPYLGQSLIPVHQDTETSGFSVPENYEAFAFFTYDPNEKPVSGDTRRFFTTRSKGTNRYRKTTEKISTLDVPYNVEPDTWPEVVTDFAHMQPAFSYRSWIRIAPPPVAKNRRGLSRASRHTFHRFSPVLISILLAFV